MLDYDEFQRQISFNSSIRKAEKKLLYIKGKGSDYMRLCRCQKIKQVKVEADISADPLWCGRCFANLDMNDFPLPPELKKELQAWIADYGQWIDWENDGIVKGGALMEEQHNMRGVVLAGRVKLTLEDQYDVVFAPAIFSRRIIKNAL
ncbi:hypothetical protein ACTHOQ_05500 [Solibacillus silvestris]|uniref:hypothetical protein n=1 Tax=Solibacillus silvestris TaxID=76853 RepID=UPI003F7F87A3